MNPKGFYLNIGCRICSREKRVESHMAKDLVQTRVIRIISDLFGVRSPRPDARLRALGVETIKETSMLTDQINHELKISVRTDEIKAGMKVSQLVELVKSRVETPIPQGA